MTDSSAPARALLFDLDGTLIDSDPLHFRAYAEVAARYGVTLTEAMFRERVSGQSNDRICRDLFPHVEVARHAAIADEKEALYRALLDDGATPTAGLADLLAWGRARGVRLGVVSNAPRANITHTLAALGLSDAFEISLSGAELPRGKPDPLPYRTAMAHFGAAPEHTVVFEDASPGLTAAVAAGAFTIGLTTSLDAEAILAAGARLAVPDFGGAALRAALMDGLGMA